MGCHYGTYVLEVRAGEVVASEVLVTRTTDQGPVTSQKGKRCNYIEVRRLELWQRVVRLKTERMDSVISAAVEHVLVGCCQ